MTPSVTFYATRPVGVSAWHRHWLKGEFAGEASVPCEGCAAPCCTSMECVTLNPAVDDVSQYATAQKPSGTLVLQKHEDGSCIYFVDGRCSIYTRRPSVCRAFDCRMYALLPPNDVMDRFGWSGPARENAELLRDTADARFPLTEKEPDDSTFVQRFMEIFVPMCNQHHDLDMSSVLASTLRAMKSMNG